MNLFTYGTLRRGGGLNFKLDDVAQYVGTYRTIPKYTLYDMGCPGLSHGGDTSVVGDVYQAADLAQIAHIYDMEIRAGYTFERVELFNFDEPVYAFFQTPDPRWGCQIIASGDWQLHKGGSIYVEDPYRTRR